MGCIGALISAFIDLILSGFIENLDTCANDDGDIFGDTEFASGAETCVYYGKSHDCQCFEEDSSSCHPFDLYKGNDCSEVLSMGGDLFWSSFITVIIAFLAFSLSLCTCQAVCCPTACGYEDESASAVQVLPSNDAPTPALAEVPVNPAQSQIPILVQAIPMSIMTGTNMAYMEEIRTKR